MASTGACSTTRPRYITATSVAIAAITPRSCVISMIAMPSSRWSWRISSRICACVVTSSAVVGSSAISSAGRQDSAIAIMARWRRPPLSWWASWSTRRSGEDTPTRRRISIVFSRACRRLIAWWSRIASTIWLPTLWTGLNEDIGSWKISAISAPRIARISWPFGSSCARFTVRAGPPLTGGRRNQISPSTIRPGRSTILKMDRAVTLLPQPLSPTMPSVAPGAMSKLTPSTAFTRPSSCEKCVFKFRTDSSLPSIRIRGVPESNAQIVEGHHDDDHGHGRQHQPRRDRHRLDVLRVLQQDAPADRRRAQAQAQEAQRRLADDHRGQGQRGGGDDVTHERRHHVHEDRPHLAAADQARRDDEVLLAQGQEASAHDARQLRPSQQRDDDGDREVDLEDRPLARQRRRQPHPQGDGRDRPQDLDHALDQRVGHPAVEAREPAQHHTQHEAHGHAEQPDGERDARAVHQPREEIAPLHVGAQHEDRARGVPAGLDADQVPRRGDQAEEPVLEALGEEPDRDLVAGIGPIDALEGLRIARALDGIDVRAEPPAVEPVDRLRGHQRALRLGRVGIGVGEEVGAEDDAVEAEDDDAAGHGQAVLAEAPPHELPLRGDEDALLLHRQDEGGHQVSSSRMRGSIQTSTMSEMSVPITVITPSRSTMVPARNISCAMRAFSSSGPTVGKPRTRETMMLPDTI